MLCLYTTKKGTGHATLGARKPACVVDSSVQKTIHAHLHFDESRTKSTGLCQKSVRFVDFASTSCSTLAVPELSAAELSLGCHDFPPNPMFYLALGDMARNKDIMVPLIRQLFQGCAL